MIEYLNLQKITALHADEIQQAVAHVVNSGWYLHGEALQTFEQAYASYIGTRWCIGCGNGLDAIGLILRAYIELGILKEGDEVLVPANTFIGTILPITSNGLNVKLIEPDIHTLQIDENRIEEAITPRTKALIIVHLYGHCAYTEKIGEICHRYQLKLIEDNAQAHGCIWKHQKTGSLGDAAAHSFYPGKNLGALGDGGAVTTSDEALATMVRMLGNYGSQQKYQCEVQGRNSRLDDIQAAVLSVKLRYLDAENARRRQLAAYYIQGISHPSIDLPLNGCAANDVYHIFPILCEQRDALQTHLAKQGISTMIHYPVPPHQQRCYAEWNNLHLPITEQIHRNELSLPLNPALTEKEIEHIIKAVNSF